MSGVERVVVATHDRAEAPALLRRTFPSLTLMVASSPRPFVFRHSAIGDGRIRCMELMVSGDAMLTGPLPDGVVAVEQVLGGRVVERGGVPLDPGSAHLRPPTPVRLRLRDAHLRLVIFDEEAFREAAKRHGVRRAGPPADRVAPVDDAAASAWRWTAAHLHDAVRDPRTLENRIVAGELFDLGVRTVLACFATPDDREADAPASPHALRRALAYLEEHATDGVSVPDVAAAARVSVRSLQLLFRRHLGVSPVEHLRAIRLDSARRDLLAAETPSAGLVGAVAARWGFGNSGRFARLYTERFRERPSDTVRGRA